MLLNFIFCCTKTTKLLLCVDPYHYNKIIYIKIYESFMKNVKKKSLECTNTSAKYFTWQRKSLQMVEEMCSSKYNQGRSPSSSILHMGELDHVFMFSPGLMHDEIHPLNIAGKREVRKKL